MQLGAYGKEFHVLPNRKIRKSAEATSLPQGRKVLLLEWQARGSGFRGTILKQCEDGTVEAGEVEEKFEVAEAR